MSGFGGAWPAVLDDAIKAARATLRDLDGPEIPPSLKRVAAYSGGKLPPPLASSLLAELDRNDWFRSRVLEDWEGEESSPAGLFLARPEGWWTELADAHSEAAGDKDESRLVELQRRADKLESQLKTASSKAAEHKKAAAEAEHAAKSLVDEAKRSVAASFGGQAEELAKAKEDLSTTSAELEALRKEHEQLNETFAGVRSRLAKARKARLTGAEPGSVERSFASHPVELARLLDLQTASFGRSPGKKPDAAPGEKPVFDLAPGVRPDSSDGIRWLLELEDPVVVLVDGYNAQFHLDRADFTSGAARRHLIEALKRLRQAATSKHRVVVVYDSTLPGERIGRSSLGGVEVRFAEQDRIADEEIVGMAGEFERVVVISSDREVREGAEDRGAVVLWSEALSDWVQRF